MKWTKWLSDRHSNFRKVIKLAGVENDIGNYRPIVQRMSFGFICLHGVSYPITLLDFNTKLKKKILEEIIEGQREWTQKSSQCYKDTFKLIIF